MQSSNIISLLDVKKALEAANKEAASLTGTRWSVLGAALKSFGQSFRKNLFDPLVILGTTIKLFKELSMNLLLWQVNNTTLAAVAP